MLLYKSALARNAIKISSNASLRATKSRPYKGYGGFVGATFSRPRIENLLNLMTLRLRTRFVEISFLADKKAASPRVSYRAIS